MFKIGAKIRVGRETGNPGFFFFFCLIADKKAIK